MPCPVCESAAEGKELLAVIASVFNQWRVSGSKVTCSDVCHERLVACLEAEYGTHYRCVRMSTGEEFRVPTRDIIERGVKERDLDQYPHWDEEDGPHART